MALNDVLNVFPNRETFENTNTLLARIAGALENKESPTGGEANFAEIKNNVGLGLGEKLYPVGTEFVSYKALSASAEVGAQNTGVTATTVDFETFLGAIDTIDRNVKVFTYNGAWYYNNTAVNPTTYGITLTGTPAANDTVLITMVCTKLTWVVLAHDHYETAGNAKYTMAIGMKYAYGTETAWKGMSYDGKEAFYTHDSDTPLAAGEYTFNLPTTEGQWAAGDYTFTTTAAHPKGAQFLISGASSAALATLKVQIYDGGFVDNTVAEECTISSGSTGTALGTMGAELNHAQRVNSGSNNYAQSNLRQFLNSKASMGNVLVQQTKYDRKAAWGTTSDAAFAGFLHGMSQAFINALSTAIVPCRTNDIFEITSIDGSTFDLSSTYTVRDKVFLLSRPEIWGTYDTATIHDGTMLDYYSGLTDLERIKYDEFGVPHYAWVRSPSPTDTSSERGVSSSTGIVTTRSAASAIGVFAACVIGNS